MFLLDAHEPLTAQKHLVRGTRANARKKNCEQVSDAAFNTFKCRCWPSKTWSPRYTFNQNLLK